MTFLLLCWSFDHYFGKVVVALLTFTLLLVIITVFFYCLFPVSGLIKYTAYVLPFGQYGGVRFVFS